VITTVEIHSYGRIVRGQSGALPGSVGMIAK